MERAEVAGLVWLGGCKGEGFRPFKEFRRLGKYEEQERFEIKVKGRKRVVSAEQIRRFPGNEPDARNRAGYLRS